MHNSKHSLRKGEHDEHWKEAKNSFNVASKRKSIDGVDNPVMQITGMKNTTDFFDDIWGPCDSSGKQRQVNKPSAKTPKKDSTKKDDKPTPHKGMSEKMRNQAFAHAETANLGAEQTLRLYRDPKLFETLSLSTVSSVKQNIDSRLTDALVFEYSAGYAYGDEASQNGTHPGMALLETLRKNQTTLQAALDLTKCLVAENCPDAQPERLLEMADALRGHGVEVTHNVERKAITNSLSRAVEDHAFHDYWDLLTRPGSTSRDPSLQGEELEKFQHGEDHQHPGRHHACRRPATDGVRVPRAHAAEQSAIVRA